MSKPQLIEADKILENQLIETMIAGHKLWRPDLDYPESYSDMQACARAVISMFEIKRRPIGEPLRIKCHGCEGLGEIIVEVTSNGGYRRTK